MVTVANLKEKMMNYLDSIDFTKMSIFDINNYVDVIKKLDEMEKPSIYDSLSMVMNGFGCKREPVATVTPAVKETSVNKRIK